MINKDLFDSAEKGDEIAQLLVVQGYSLGIQGFEQNPEILLDLAEKDWNSARDNVVLGYKLGTFGFEKNHEMLEELAEKGWKMAKWYLQQEKSKESGQV